MIDVKTAVAKAIECLGNLLESDSISGMRLEEVELSDDQSTWSITLSFVRRTPSTTSSPAEAIRAIQSMTLGVPMGEREYKIVAVNSANGEIRSMKIRQLA